MSFLELIIYFFVGSRQVMWFASLKLRFSLNLEFRLLESWVDEYGGINRPISITAMLPTPRKLKANKMGHFAVVHKNMREPKLMAWLSSIGYETVFLVTLCPWKNQLPRAWFMLTSLSASGQPLVQVPKRRCYCSFFVHIRSTAGPTQTIAPPHQRFIPGMFVPYGTYLNSLNNRLLTRATAASF